VGATYTSQTCLESAPENRPKGWRESNDIIEMNRFLRVRHAVDDNRNAARVIALKSACLREVPPRKDHGGRELRNDEKGPRYLIDAVTCRGDRPGGSSRSGASAKCGWRSVLPGNLGTCHGTGRIARVAAQTRNVGPIR
jgi:hypothetical protein